MSGLQNKTKHIAQLVGYAEGSGRAIFVVTKLYANGPLSRRIYDSSVVYDTSFVLRIAREICLPCKPRDGMVRKAMTF